MDTCCNRSHSHVHPPTPRDDFPDATATVDGGPPFADSEARRTQTRNPLECKGDYSGTSNNINESIIIIIIIIKLVHWPLMGGLLHLIQQKEDWAGP